MNVQRLLLGSFIVGTMVIVGISASETLNLSASATSRIVGVPNSPPLPQCTGNWELDCSKEGTLRAEALRCATARSLVNISRSNCWRTAFDQCKFQGGTFEWPDDYEIYEVRRSGFHLKCLMALNTYVVACKNAKCGGSSSSSSPGPSPVSRFLPNSTTLFDASASLPGQVPPKR